MENKELYHHGVLGMKWGVWNDETQARYSGGSKRKISDDERKKRETMRKRKSEMSTKELMEVNNRLQAEQNYDRLTSKGKTVGDRIVEQTKNIVVSAAATALGAVIVAEGKEFISYAVDKVAWKFVG